MEVINLSNKLQLFDDHWNPRIIAELNGQLVKVAKIKGEFIWHKHDAEDELFYVVDGELSIELRDKTLHLRKGEMTVIPAGVEHKPIAHEECAILLFEPKSTLNTGDQKDDLTKEKLQWI